MARAAKFSEHQMCLDWLNANKENNDFDEQVLDYPTAEIYVAPEENPTSCMPIHAGMILESIGFAEGLDAKEKLANTLELLMKAKERCGKFNIKEIYFLSSDPRTDEYAEKVLGFAPVKAYRRVIL